jgi:formamidopyrimidine-DNA glycosylase
MTGRMYLQPAKMPLPKHAAVVLGLGRQQFVFEDTRYFGRLTLDHSAIAALGPEPLGEAFTTDYFAAALKRSAQAIKVKLLDQQLVAGVGNIYASEALFRAGISPRAPARSLKPPQVARLRQTIRETLREAIKRGSTVPLNYSGEGESDGLFYFGSAPGAPDFYEERLRVYDRAGKPCRVCQTSIKRMVQGARSTFYCPHCQRR